MTDIKSTPDKNGVPMCEGEGCATYASGECESFPCFTGVDDDDIICYLKMVQIVKAAEGMLIPAGNAIPSDCDEMELALNALLEALSHE